MDAPYPIAQNKIMDSNTSKETHFEKFLLQIQERSDNLMNYFLAGYFVIGLVLATYYDTWLIAIGVGGLSLIAYYSTKYFLRNSNQYQYVLSTVFGIFMAQFIYQMHGMFEMHFFAFIGSAILITYQNWKLQIPLALVVIIHHASFGYLQYIGYSEIYFTQLDYMTLETFIIHGILATGVFALCGLWAYNFKKYSNVHIRQSFKIGQLQEEDRQKDAMISERKLAESKLLHLLDITNDQNQQLQNFAYIVSHNIRSHSANINGLVNIFNQVPDVEKTRLHDMLLKSSEKLEETIENLNNIITIQNDSRKQQSNVNLKHEIDKSCNAINSMIFQANATIINNVTNDMAVAANPSYLESILLNLLTNAIKYKSPERNPTVIFDARKSGNYLVLSIQDNGIGIDLEKHGKAIFGMYKTFHQNKDAKGFGLYLTKNQVESMGGKIEVESTPGKGSIFKVYLLNETALTDEKEN
jgi:signal transduction histidine kinase